MSDDREVVRLLGLSGSLRAGSTNTALLRAAAEVAAPGVEVRIHPLGDLPFYDGDIERRSGFPPAVQRLRDAIDDADGLLLASPEYNWSTTAVLKNAIDWASRGWPSPLDRKPTALLSAAGGSGGVRAQAHLRDILGHNAVDVIDDAVRIARAREHVVDGRLVTPEYRRAVTTLVERLVQHIARVSGADAA